VQGDNVGCVLWQKPPLCYASDLEAALREPYDDQPGAREAYEILKKLLTLGLSKFEPDRYRQSPKQSSGRRRDELLTRPGKLIQAAK
jgi:hypothetical protein